MLRSILSLTQQLKTQQQFLAKVVAPVLEEASALNDGTLSAADFKKITGYYGLAVPAVLGEAICFFRGTTMTAKERLASTCQGAMTGLFDDFFDNDYLDAHEVEAKIAVNMQPGVSEKSNERLFTHFYNEALANVDQPSLMRDALQAVHHAQVNSRKQTDPEVPLQEIMEITEEKGGSSLLFYRTAFHPPASAEESRALHHLGATMQIANDIFDVYKDRAQDIRTVMTETKSVKEVRTLLLHRLHEGYNLAYELGFPRQRTEQFLACLSIGIFSRCFVCLDQLEKNQRLTNGEFVVQAYSRKQLICDMDTKKNMLRSAAYHLKYFF